MPAGAMLVSVLNPDGSLVGSGGGGGSVTVTNFPTTQRTAPVANDSISGRATVAAPAAATSLLSVASTTAGLYEVNVTVAVTGVTVAANDSNNMGLYVNAVLKAVIPYLVTGVTGMATYSEARTLQFSIGAAQNVEIRSMTNAATASSSYMAALSITKMD